MANFPWKASQPSNNDNPDFSQICNLIESMSSFRQDHPPTPNTKSSSSSPWTTASSTLTSISSSITHRTSSSSSSNSSSIFELPPPTPAAAAKPLSLIPHPTLNVADKDSLLRRRGFSNPLEIYLAPHLTPHPTPAILNTKLTKPRKSVHFHPSHSTRHFSENSKTGYFLTSSFSPTHPPGRESRLAMMRRQDAAESGIRRLLDEPYPNPTPAEQRRLEEQQGRKKRQKKRHYHPRTCVTHVLNLQREGRLSSVLEEGVACTTEHESMSAVHARVESTVRALHADFLARLTPKPNFSNGSHRRPTFKSNAEAAIDTPPLTARPVVHPHPHPQRDPHPRLRHAAEKAVNAKLADLQVYLCKHEIWDNAVKWQSCADAYDVKVFDLALEELQWTLDGLFEEARVNDISSTIAAGQDEGVGIKDDVDFTCRKNTRWEEPQKNEEKERDREKAKHAAQTPPSHEQENLTNSEAADAASSLLLLHGFGTQWTPPATLASGDHLSNGHPN